MFRQLLEIGKKLIYWFFFSVDTRTLRQLLRWQQSLSCITVSCEQNFAEYNNDVAMTTVFKEWYRQLNAEIADVYLKNLLEVNFNIYNHKKHCKFFTAFFCTIFPNYKPVFRQNPAKNSEITVCWILCSCMTSAHDECKVIHVPGKEIMALINLLVVFCAPISVPVVVLLSFCTS